MWVKTPRRVRTPGGPGAVVGRVVRQGHATALLVLRESTESSLALIRRVEGIDAPVMVDAFPVEEYIEVKCGSESILRRIG